MRALQLPKYNPGDKVIVRDAPWLGTGDARGAIIQAVWYDYKLSTWTYATTEGRTSYMNKALEEQFVLGLYTPAKLLHYANKGL